MNQSEDVDFLVPNKQRASRNKKKTLQADRMRTVYLCAAIFQHCGIDLDEVR